MLFILGLPCWLSCEAPRNRLGKPCASAWRASCRSRSISSHPPLLILTKICEYKWREYSFSRRKVSFWLECYVAIYDSVMGRGTQTISRASLQILRCTILIFVSLLRRFFTSVSSKLTISLSSSPSGIKSFFTHRHQRRWVLSFPTIFCSRIYLSPNPPVFARFLDFFVKFFLESWILNLFVLKP